MKRTVCLAACLLLAAAPAAAANAEAESVLETYADIAHAMYTDSLDSARRLEAAVDALVAAPSADTLAAAREAWLAARIPYQQTEAYRFGNAIVDDWEGKVNAWPLDEGLIDYVDAGYGSESEDNPLYTANVIANTSISYGGETIDTSTIDAGLLAERLHEVGQIEANVATGYHAIEFLLWGQDLNGTDAGAGGRSWTDYDTANCTNGNCGRRAAYLVAATELLVGDLTWMAGQWVEDGAAREALTADGAENGVATILTGLGSLSYGELAGERIKLGLLLHDPEEEHDCFSDNTHNSHYYDVVGMMAVYTGRYAGIDSESVSGASLSEFVAARDPALDAEMLRRLAATHDAARVLKERAETVEAYDQMIGEGNAVGNAVVQNLVDALTAQTKTIERIVAALDLDTIAIEGSDSLDDPAKVFE